MLNQQSHPHVDDQVNRNGSHVPPTIAVLKRPLNKSRSTSRTLRPRNFWTTYVLIVAGMIVALFIVCMHPVLGAGITALLAVALVRLWIKFIRREPLQDGEKFSASLIKFVQSARPFAMTKKQSWRRDQGSGRKKSTSST